MKDRNDLQGCGIQAIDDQIGTEREEKDWQVGEVSTGMALAGYCGETLERLEELVLKMVGCFGVVLCDEVPNVLEVPQRFGATM